MAAWSNFAASGLSAVALDCALPAAVPPAVDCVGAAVARLPLFCATRMTKSKAVTPVPAASHSFTGSEGITQAIACSLTQVAPWTSQTMLYNAAQWSRG